MTRRRRAHERDNATLLMAMLLPGSVSGASVTNTGVWQTFWVCCSTACDLSVPVTGSYVST
jgi:hypothetical protein